MGLITGSNNINVILHRQDAGCEAACV